MLHLLKKIFVTLTTMRLIKLFFNNYNLLVEASNALNSCKCNTS